LRFLHKKFLALQGLWWVGSIFLCQKPEAILTLIDFIINNRNFDDFPFEITRGHYIYIDGTIITLENLADFFG